MQEILNEKTKELYSHELANKELIIKYVNFCVENNKHKHTKFLTNAHHILPRSLFREYINFKENPWNRSFLTHSDHLDAHKMLFDAFPIHQNSSAYSFMTGMYHKDNEEYKIRKEEISKLHSKHLNEVIEVNGESLSRAKHMGKKSSKTLTKVKNGTTIAKERGKKISKSKNKIIIIDGKKTTTTKEASKKSAIIAKKKIIIDGEETSIARERSLKAYNTVRQKPKKQLLRLKRIQESLDKVITVDNKETTSRIEGFKKRKETMEDYDYTERSKKRKETIDKNWVKGEIGNRIREGQNKETIDEEGNKIKIKDLVGRKQSITKRAKAKKYNIMKGNEIYLSNLVPVEIRKMCQSLMNTTKEKPLGSSRCSKLNLNRNKKLHLIGLWIKEI